MVGVRYPVVQTGMGWVAGSSLVTATAKAGGLGILASATMTLEQLTEQIAEVRAETDAPFGVNMRTDVADVEERIAVMLDAGVKVASFAQAPRPDLVAYCRDKGLVVLPTVGARRHAEKMAGIGVSAVIAQGAEGGGHTGVVPTSLLTPDVAQAVGEQIPVISAGGWSSGAGLVAAIALGADGIAMGTRFLLTTDSRVPDEVKAQYLATPVTGTVVSTRIDGAPQRVIRTELVEHLEGSSWLANLPRSLRSAHQFRKETGDSLLSHGDEEGQRAHLAPGRHGRQRPRDDQGRSGRRAHRRGRAAHRSGDRRHHRAALGGRADGPDHHRGEHHPRSPRLRLPAPRVAP